MVVNRTIKTKGGGMRFVVVFTLLLLIGCSQPTPSNHPPIPPLPKVAPKATHTAKLVTASVLPPGVIAITNWDTCNVTLAWTKSTSPEVIGYNVYFGARSHFYETHIDAGNTNQATIPIAPNSVYYIAATAYTTNGESEFSNEITHMSPPLVLHIAAYAETNSTLTGDWGIAAQVDVLITNIFSPVFSRARVTMDYTR